MFIVASRNVADWWLSYWITHSQDGYPHNITIPSSVTLSNSHYSSVSDSPFINIVSGSDNLYYYLGIYGGLALANSVSC